MKTEKFTGNEKIRPFEFNIQSIDEESLTWEEMVKKNIPINGFAVSVNDNKDVNIVWSDTAPNHTALKTGYSISTGKSLDDVLFDEEAEIEYFPNNRNFLVTSNSRSARHHVTKYLQRCIPNEGRNVDLITSLTGYQKSHEGYNGKLGHYRREPYNPQ